MFVALAASSGLILGKLADMLLPIAYRDTQVLGPLVRCKHCGRRATTLDLIPLAEGIFRGRCYECGAALPYRWFLLPIGTALLAGLCYQKFGELDQALIGTLFSAILLALIFTDLERRLLPDRIVLPSIVAAAALAWGLPEGAITSSGYGAIAALVIAAVLILGSLPFGQNAFGMGDAKLILLLGVLLGPRYIIVAVLMAFIGSGVLAGGLLLTRQRARGSHLPLGPFLAVGGIIALVWGAEIWHWWVE